MTTCRQLLRFRKVVILLGTPLALLPLPLSMPLPEVECAFILILTAVYWCTEVIPSAITSLLPVVLFPLFGIMESQKVCMQYLKDANMLFIGDLIVAGAVENWNLHKRMALKVLLTLGVKPARLMLGFMAVTAFLSMWISNTTTTSLMVPIVEAVIDVMNSSEEGTMFTESILSIPYIKGMTERGYTKLYQEANDYFSSTEDSFQRESVEMQEAEMQSIRIKNRLHKGLTLSVCYAATIGGTATLTGTGTNVVLKGQLDQLFPKNKDVVNYANWFAFAFPNMILMLTLACFWLQFSFVGFNFKKTWSTRGEKTKKEEAIFNLLKKEYLKLGPVSFAEFNVLLLFLLLVILWLTRDPGFFPGWATVFFGSKKKYVTDATAALFIATLMFIVPSSKPVCCPSNSSGAMKEQFLSRPLLDWKMVQKDVSWNVVLLIGGGFALAHGSEASGLFKWLEAQLAFFRMVPPWAIALIGSVMVAMFTECASNVATATLFLPVFASLSQSIKINPLYAMISCTLSASFAFMLPVATPPNAIVFSYGHLRILDLAKNGAVMNVIGIICVALSLNTWGRVMFNLDEFPSWARANVTSP